jgi:hypothetical protein
VPSPLRPQSFDFKIDVRQISTVSHDPSPSQCRLLTSAPIVAMRWRALDAIQAIYLFVICLLLIRPHQKAGQRAAPIPSSQPAAKRNGQRSPLTIARA